MKIIGIDVGGTNTDATLISRDRRVLGMVKVPTDHNHILASTKAALKQILTYNEANQPVKLQLSTTLSTNAIVEGKGEATAVLAIPGPGINLADFQFNFPVYSLRGYVDHRGRLIRDLDESEVVSAASEALAAGAQSLAIVGKFSQRNNSLEVKAQDLILAADLKFNHITLGHQLSGKLNFPRRIITAYLNSSVAKQQVNFAAVIKELQVTNPIIKEVQVLKADGGTMGLDESCLRPVETILSGPAASIMAAQALTESQTDNLVVVDIGGTTSDIAVISGGEALYQRDGAIIGNKRTLVPALFTRSIGLGGDSEVRISADKVSLGPKRAGKAVCLGGSRLTPTDAAVALGLVKLGDRARSIAALDQEKQGKYDSWQKLAQVIMTSFAKQLSLEIKRVYRYLREQPVYTVSELLAPFDLSPKAIVGLGAPAAVFIPLIAAELDLGWEVLPFHAGSNAIGAAAARPTVAITVHVDTEQEQVIIPELGSQFQLRRSALFEEKQARQLAREQIREHARKIGLEDYGDIQIVEEEVFNVVRGFYTVGRIFNLRVQIRPQVSQIGGSN